MITIYSNSEDKKLKTVDSLSEKNWIKLVSPTQSEIKKITKELALPALFLEEACDINVRPKIEEDGKNKLLVVHVPYFDPKIEHDNQSIKYRTIPFSIILTDTHFITVCQEDVLVTEIFSIIEIADFGVKHHTKNTLSILNSVANQYIEFTKMIESDIAQSEEELSRSYRNPQLYALLYLNESLLCMTVSLKQILYTMRKIEHDTILEMHEYEHEIFTDTLIEFEHAYSITEINQLNSNNVMDAYGNIIQNNVSHVVKLLTAITIILSIPTLIASIYGMNVPLPLQEEPQAFSALICIMVVASVAVALIFRKKNYI